MKKMIFLLILRTFVLNFNLLVCETTNPIITIDRQDGGGSIWNLWGEFYERVSETHNTQTNVHNLECKGNGRLACRWHTDPPKPTACIGMNGLYDEMEDYAGSQIENGVLSGSYSNIVNCQGDAFLRSVLWNATDINNILLLLMWLGIMYHSK